MIAHDVRGIAFDLMREARYETGNRLFDLAAEIELMEIDRRELTVRARQAPPAPAAIDLTGMLSPMPVAIEMDVEPLGRWLQEEHAA